MEARRASGSRNFVLVHGAWHGGWCYRRVADLLRAQGHYVETLTLTGLGERSHLAQFPVNCSTVWRKSLSVFGPPQCLTMSIWKNPAADHASRRKYASGRRMDESAHGSSSTQKFPAVRVRCRLGLSKAAARQSSFLPKWCCIAPDVIRDLRLIS
jgi:hypothetical protein